MNNNKLSALIPIFLITTTYSSRKPFFLLVVPSPVAIYPLDGVYQGRDIGPRRNLPAKPIGVVLAKGPDRQPSGSFQFSGTPNSYVYFPNNGGLNAKKTITLLAWVFPQSPGPIFHYNPKGFGVHMWLTTPRTLFVNFKDVSGRRIRAVTSRSIKPNAWNYIGATYDGQTGLATIWRNSLPVAQRNIGRGIRLDTKSPAIMGKRSKGRQPFRGRIACMQVYRVALNGPQMAAVKKKCFRKGAYI